MLTVVVRDTYSVVGYSIKKMNLPSYSICLQFQVSFIYLALNREWKVQAFICCLPNAYDYGMWQDRVVVLAFSAFCLCCFTLNHLNSLYSYPV